VDESQKNMVRQAITAMLLRANEVSAGGRMVTPGALEWAAERCDDAVLRDGAVWAVFEDTVGRTRAIGPVSVSSTVKRDGDDHEQERDGAPEKAGAH
jgi:hypothetical protein